MIEEINEIEMMGETDTAHYNSTIQAGLCPSCRCYAEAEELRENNNLCRDCNESVKAFNDEFERQENAGGN